MRMVGRSLMLTGVLVAALCATAGIRPASASSDVTATTEPALQATTIATAATADDAVRAAVEATGDSYAGDCAATVSPRDVGKVCAKFAAEKDGVRAYMAGRTFSEFSRWVFVTADPTGGWRVVAVADLDFFATTIPWPARG